MEAAQYVGDGLLDMLVNIAGVGPEHDNWHEHTAETLMEKFAINTAANILYTRPLQFSLTLTASGSFPCILVSKSFYPNLTKAGGTIINISSNAGSITHTVKSPPCTWVVPNPRSIPECKGEDLGYCMTKAALNMMTVTMTQEFQMNGDNISVIALIPGYVATRLTNFRLRNDMDECIAGIVKVLGKVGMKETSTFLNWRGETLPW